MRTNCIHCDCPLMCLVGEKRTMCARCLSIKWKRARIKQAAKKPPKAIPVERICKDCKQPFSVPDGRSLRQCDACKRAHKKVKSKQYYDAHKDQLSQKDRQRYYSDPSIRRQRSRQYYESHREQVILKMRERRKAIKVESTKLGMMR